MSSAQRRVFISSTASDRSLSSRLCRDLARAGLLVTAIDQTVGPGDSLATKIAEGIERADVFVVILSRAAARSAWMATEIALVVARRAAHQRPRVVPVRAEPEVETPFFLQDLVYVDMSNDAKYDAGLPRLISTVNAPETIPSREESSVALRLRLSGLDAERQALLREQAALFEHAAFRNSLVESSVAFMLVVGFSVVGFAVLAGVWSGWTGGVYEWATTILLVASLIANAETLYSSRRLRREGRSPEAGE